MSHPDPHGPPDRTPIKVGEVWEDLVTGERATILERPWDNPAGRATAVLTALVGAPVVGEHRHSALVACPGTSQLRTIPTKARFKLDGKYPDATFMHRTARMIRTFGYCRAPLLIANLSFAKTPRGHGATWTSYTTNYTSSPSRNRSGRSRTRKIGFVP